MAQQSSEAAKRIVIIGGGAIGCSAAYYLTRHPRYVRDEYHITLLEATKIAGGASGKAGGFIASWADPPCLAGLTWQLHMDLANEYDGANRWGYRRCRLLDCDVNLQGAAGSESPLETVSPVPDWVYSDRLKTCAMRGNGTYGSAQVHPYHYTTTLAEQAKAKGVNIIIGSATSIGYSEDGKAVKSVSYRLKDSQDIHELPAEYVIAAAGPWTPTVLPKVPVTGARNNSIHLSVPTSEISTDLVFFNNVVPDSWFPRVKLYPRPDDTIHISAGTDYKVPLPPSTDLVEVDRDLHYIRGGFFYNSVMRCGCDAGGIKVRSLLVLLLSYAAVPSYDNTF